MEDIQTQVMRLVSQAWPFPEQPLPSGSTDTEMDAFGERTGVSLPGELREWLHLCNGAVIGPGGVYGLSEMAQQFTWHPEWKEKGWIAIAGDGCGDTYILDSRTIVGDTHPIYFLDHETCEGKADYIVASGLWLFLRFLLAGDVAREMARKRGEKYVAYWPFNTSKVLAEDPALVQYEGDVPLPWDTH